MQVLLDILTGLAGAVWTLTLEMAPYLLFGFLVAGVLHLFLPREKVARHLSRNDTASVVKASLLGVPLPLCSCGVIPVAAHLDKQGAGRGPVLSFLVSTPTTGVDSIAATYGLLGPLLAVMRPIAALFNGVLIGLMVNRAAVPAPEAADLPAPEPAAAAPRRTPMEALRHIVTYAFGDLIEDVAKWLIIGILLGGAISYAIPTEMVTRYLGTAWLAYPLMLVLGIPMYVCATGSIPIAAALVLKGMSPGAGFIFLMVGPATNTATLSFVAGSMGRRTVTLYVIAIVVSALLFGWLIDAIWALTGYDMALVGGQMEMLPHWLELVSALVLIALIFIPYGRAVMNRLSDATSGMQNRFRVPDMTCKHCVATIDKAVRAVDGVDDITINLDAHVVAFSGSADRTAVETAIRDAGYTVEDAS